jgi:hypothetical protein
MNLRIDDEAAQNLLSEADVGPNKTKLTGPPPRANTRKKASTGGSG